MASVGSTLFTLTWNDAVTPSGRRICALRASARRTSGSGCTSWPTPTLPTVAGRAKWATAPWPTPLANVAAGGGSESHLDGRRSNLRDAAFLAEDFQSRAVAIGHAASNKHGDNARPLNEVARLASWNTPAAQEAGGSPEQFLTRKAKAKAKGAELGVSLTSLSMQAQLADPGIQPTGSSAEIPPVGRPSLGQLNPEHSRWLQGYPAAWGYCGAMVTRSPRKSR
jgi:hypothetical protein